jgi:hypothetical protein
MRQHAVQGCFHSSGEVVERALGACPQKDVQAHGEDTLLATLERVPQTLGVFKCHLALWVCQSPAADVYKARRLQLHEFVTEKLDDAGRLQWVHMKADFDRVLELQQRRQPTGDNGPRITNYSQNASVLILQAQVIACYLNGGRGKQVGQRARAKGKATFLV